ncbi:MAG: L-threonine 3-dehydrogenase [Acidimicrobiia bacterium]
MRALVKAKPEPGIWMQDVDRPSMGPNDALISVTKTSICGTDLHIEAWDDWASATIPVPMTIGHEYVGIVEEIGTEVDGISVGQRVSGEGHVVCGHCRNCQAGRRHLCINTIGVGVNRPGAFAEYVAVPSANLQPIPAEIPDDIASILDPLGNAVHTALHFDLVGEDVLITGAGPIGMMAVAVSRHVGARYVVVTDINDYRLALCEEMGADRELNVNTDSIDSAMKDLGMVEGFDVGLEMSGQPSALHDMITRMNNGAGIALLGIPPKQAPIDWHDIVFKGLTLHGIYGRRMFETWYKMLAMLETGLDVAGVVTHHFAAEDYEDAFAVVRSGECGKVILDWTSVSG